MNIQKAITQQTKSNLFVSLASKPGKVGVRFYNSLFQHYNIDAEYVACECKNLSNDLSLVKKYCSGASITMPFKKEALNYVDVIVDQGPTNTIKVDNQTLISYNCDYRGMKNLLESFVINKRITLLGDGAMADNIKLLCKKSKIYQYSRKLNNWNNRYTECDVLINTTSIGMDTFQTPVDSVEFTNVVVDCVIGETKLIKLAKQSSKPTVNGQQLYISQLLHQFKIYTNIDPDRELVNQISNNVFL